MISTGWCGVLLTHADRIAEAALDAPDFPTELEASLGRGLGRPVRRAGTFDPKYRSWVAGSVSYLVLTIDAAKSRSSSAVSEGTFERAQARLGSHDVDKHPDSRQSHQPPNLDQP